MNGKLNNSEIIVFQHYLHINSSIPRLFKFFVLIRFSLRIFIDITTGSFVNRFAMLNDIILNFLVLFMNQRYFLNDWIIVWHLCVNCNACTSLLMWDVLLGVTHYWKSYGSEICHNLIWLRYHMTDIYGKLLIILQKQCFIYLTHKHKQSNRKHLQKQWLLL